MANRNQRIILTGASDGIGRALALEYARRGARVVLVARREELLRDVAEEMRGLGGEAVALAMDVTDPTMSGRAVALADERFGGVDLVIMNAGLGYTTFVHDFKAEQAERIMQVNYISIVRMLEAVLPRMLAENRGHIVAVSSLAAYRGMPGSGPYNASKAAVTVLMESLRTELHSTDIALTTIAPGFIRTAMTSKNEFQMPFLMGPEEAARRMIRAIDARRREYRFPFGTSMLVRISQWLPNWLYDPVLAWSRRAATPRVSDDRR